MRTLPDRGPHLYQKHDAMASACPIYGHYSSCHQVRSLGLVKLKSSAEIFRLKQTQFGKGQNFTIAHHHVINEPDIDQLHSVPYFTGN